MWLTLGVKAVSMRTMEPTQASQFYRGFGAAVRRRRDSLAMTQSTLGQRIGLTRSSVANLEAGRQRVPLHVLQQLSEALDVSAQELLPAPMAPAATFDLEQVEREVSSESSHAADFVRSIMRTLAQGFSTDEASTDPDHQKEHPAGPGGPGRVYPLRPADRLTSGRRSSELG